jgi:hypothetical protein
MKAACNLAVMTENQIGSTSTKVFSVSITFDRAQAVNAVWEYAAPGLNQAPYAEAPFLIERLKVTNDYSYPLHFNFRTNYTVNLAPCYTVSIPRTPEPLCSVTLISAGSEDIKVSNDRVATRDQSGALDFTLQPHEQIVFEGYYHLDPGLTMTTTGPIRGFSISINDNYTKKFVGSCVVSRSEKPFLFVTQELDSQSPQFEAVDPVKQPLPSTAFDYYHLNVLP